MYRTTLNRSPDSQAPPAPQVFDSPATVGSANNWANAVSRTAGDFTGSGGADMVLRYANGTVMRYGRKSDGSFDAGQQLVSGSNGWYDAARVTAGYFNGDGLADLLLRGVDGSVTVYQGTGGGGFAAGSQITDGRAWSTYLHQPTFSWKAVEDITAGDFTKDGKADVVLHWINQYDSKTPGGGQTELLASTGNTPQLFGAPSVLKWASPGRWTNNTDTLVADVDEDGKAHLITRQNRGATIYYLGSGNGGFGAGQEIGGTGSSSRRTSSDRAGRRDGAHPLGDRRGPVRQPLGRDHVSFTVA
ncbi:MULTISPECIES: VCBS repeat-containing protein [unclassified Kitasatospora]|uniref:FG-GAP repeat domain-containing protein n=1 Tax=unclassified Kitasatospora TaxID=2633591 RepID=UPI00340B1230